MGSHSWSRLAGGILLGVLLCGDGSRGEEPLAPLGERIFLHDFGLPRTWSGPETLGDGGDGLGPQFNDFSCVACHNQAGTGGAGPVHKNALVLSFLPPESREERVLNPQLRAATEVHPQFSATRVTTPLHRFGLPTEVDAASYYEEFLGAIFDGVGFSAASVEPVRGNFKGANFEISQRNTIALWGAGLIDELRSKEGDAIRRRLMEEQNAKFPWLSGREPRDSTQTPGWFGWRGQTATLHNFNLGACAIEVGLTVPNIRQHRSPIGQTPVDRGPDPSLDLTEQQCLELTAFVASLPAPEQVLPVDAVALDRVRMGEAVFESCHCNACHVRDLGWVTGIYSDLLMHDMGPGLCDALAANPEILPGETIPVTLQSGRDNGYYYGPPIDLTQVIPPRAKPCRCDCEWRTPPLWGCADSAPYLHDGRAPTLHDAIMLHGGEGETSRDAYQLLTPPERSALLAFLETLRAPQLVPATPVEVQLAHLDALESRPPAAQASVEAPDHAIPAELPVGDAAVVDLPQPAEPVAVSRSVYDQFSAIVALPRITQGNLSEAETFCAAIERELPESAVGSYLRGLVLKQGLKHEASLAAWREAAEKSDVFAFRAKQLLLREELRKKQYVAALQSLRQFASEVQSTESLADRDRHDLIAWTGVVVTWLREPSGLSQVQPQADDAATDMRQSLPPELQAAFDHGVADVNRLTAQLRDERASLLALAEVERAASLEDLQSQQAAATGRQAELTVAQAETAEVLEGEISKLDEQLLTLEAEYIERDEADRRFNLTMAPIQLQMEGLIAVSTGSNGFINDPTILGRVSGMRDQLRVLGQQREENRSAGRICALKGQKLTQDRSALANEYARLTGAVQEQLASLDQWQGRIEKATEKIEGEDPADARKVARIDRRIRELSTYDRFDQRAALQETLLRFTPAESSSAASD
jgi:CxxC motif-containing protein (DUF1111 family)